MINLYALFDTETETFGNIFEAKSHEVAKRLCLKSVKGLQETSVSEITDDDFLYDLVFLGCFDTTSRTFDSESFVVSSFVYSPYSEVDNVPID